MAAVPQHTHAFKAAEASECAADQAKFWEYSKILFENQRNLTEDNLKAFAGRLKLDQSAFDECLDSSAKKVRVKADMVEGRYRQLSYTPSIYVNGELLKWPGAEKFEVYIKSL